MDWDSLLVFAHTTVHHTHCAHHILTSSTVCTALFAVCKLINADLINAVLPTIVELLSHPKEMVRKKAVMALHRFHQLDPSHDGALHGVDLDRHFRQMLCDKVWTPLCCK